jgi:hypothetical protein
MKESNKKLLVDVVSQVMSNEFKELTIDIENLNKKLKEKDETISTLLKQIGQIEETERQNINYKLFYHMHNHTCPECN